MIHPFHPGTLSRLQIDHWFINNFRFFGGGIRGVFGGVLTCFSSSLLSIFRVKNQVKIVKNYGGAWTCRVSNGNAKNMVTHGHVEMVMKMKKIYGT